MENKGLTRTEKLSSSISQSGLSSDSNLGQKKIQNFFNSQREKAESLKYADSKKEKLLNQYVNTINRKTINFSKQFPDSLVYKFSKIEKKIETLETFPNLLLKSVFKEFDTCQIIVHQKGDKVVQSFSSNKSSNIKKETFPTKEFNKVFTTIKKSKHKKFDQSKITSSILNFVGHFLADNIETDQYNLVISISRNGFLPLDKSERDTFKTGLNFIKSYLELLALNNNTNILNILYRLSFKYYPMPLSLVKNELVILSNDKYQIENKEKLNKVETKVNDHFQICEFINYKDLSSSIIHDEKIKLLGELLNTLKHELSNPLFGLQLSSEILKSEKENEDELNIVQELETSVTRCHDIIQTFSSLSSENEDDQEFNLEDLINEIFLFSKSATKPIKKLLNSNLENKIVSGHYTVLFQIIFNLVVNAAQAIKESTLVDYEQFIKVNLSEYESHFSIMVIDSGPGIPQENQDLIFRPFFTTKKSGNGLGLSICKALAKKIGADLDYSLNEGKTCFEVKLKK